MKVAVFCESPADEAALRVLLQAMRNDTLALVAIPAGLRTHGWPSVRNLLPNALRHLYFNTDADALVVLADSDDSPIHTAAHDQTGGFDPKCRLCDLRSTASATLNEIHGKKANRNLHFAIGIAVPSIEAWWRCGLDIHATEQAWARCLPTGRFPFTRRALKLAVYGTERPSLSTETTKMVESARRLAQDISALQRNFPVGFGTMVTAIQNW